MKPWEETWEARGPYVIVAGSVDPEKAPWGEDVAVTTGGETADETYAKARLMAAAPELLRALELAQFCLWNDCETGAACPVCYEKDFDGHAPDCAIGAALRKAGGE